MLKKARCFVQNEYVLKVDDYVPLTFQLNSTYSYVPCYWRTGNFKTSLIEIGLNPENGSICRLVVPFFKATQISDETYKIEKTFVNPMSSGICFDTTAWPRDGERLRFIDEFLDFNSHVGRDFVSINILDKSTVASTINLGRLVIGLNNADELVQLNFIQLTPVEIKLILGSAKGSE